MSRALSEPRRSLRGPWLAVLVGTILLAGAVALTVVLNEQPPLQPVTVSSATP